MEEIRIFVEHLLSLMGFTGTVVTVSRHVLLIVIIAFLAWMTDFLARKLLVPLILKITKKTEVAWDDILLNERVLISACHILLAVVIWEFLPMVFYQFPVVQRILERLTAIYITVASARTTLVFVGSFNQLEIHPRRSATQQYLKSFCGVLKILVLFVATIIVVAIVLGKSPMTLFAGLGATSAILMLVFKDTIEGLMSGIRLTSNDMLHRGDWITVPGTQINGVVKDISLTTVKVQNFDNTIITISPTTLVNGSFQNWIGMQQSPGRRVQRKVYFDFRSITFEDAERTKTNIGRFRADMEHWLAEREDVNAELNIMVRQLEATQCGIPLEFYFFLKQKEWKTYETHLAEIMEYVYVIASDYGLKIYQQYPEQ